MRYQISKEISLLYMSKQGVGTPLLTENELGSIPKCTAKNIRVVNFDDEVLPLKQREDSLNLSRPTNMSL